MQRIEQCLNVTKIFCTTSCQKQEFSAHLAGSVVQLLKIDLSRNKTTVRSVVPSGQASVNRKR